MAKLGCKCGATIVDQSDGLPYKAHFFLDVVENQVYSSLLADISELVLAVHNHKDQAWLKEHFGLEGHHFTSYETMVDLVLSKHLTSHLFTAYQCEECNRVHLENPKKPNHFISFAPDDQSDEAGRIFASESAV